MAGDYLLENTQYMGTVFEPNFARFVAALINVSVQWRETDTDCAKVLYLAVGIRWNPTCLYTLRNPLTTSVLTGNTLIATGPCAMRAW